MMKKTDDCKKQILNRAAFSAGILCGCLLAGGTYAAPGGSLTSNFDVSVTVPTRCSVFTAGALSFNGSTYDPTEPAGGTNDATATGNFTIKCVKTQNTSKYTITMDQGKFGTSTSTRQMQCPAATCGVNTLLNYNIYKETGHTNIWGNGTAPDPTGVGYQGTGSSDTSVSYYGLLPAGQPSAVAGSYNDVVKATISW